MRRARPLLGTIVEITAEGPTHSVLAAIEAVVRVDRAGATTDELSRPEK